MISAKSTFSNYQIVTKIHRLLQAVTKNLPWIKFSNANGARWLVAVLMRDSIFGLKNVGNSIFAQKSPLEFCSSVDEGSGW